MGSHYLAPQRRATFYFQRTTLPVGPDTIVKTGAKRERKSKSNLQPTAWRRQFAPACCSYTRRRCCQTDTSSTLESLISTVSARSISRSRLPRISATVCGCGKREKHVRDQPFGRVEDKRWLQLSPKGTRVSLEHTHVLGILATCPKKTFAPLILRTQHQATAPR